MICAVVLGMMAVAGAASGTIHSDGTDVHDLHPSTAVSYSYHKLSQSEMSGLRATFGDRDPFTDYNVIVDGHGTGLAPPTAGAWDSMVGSLNVVDSIEADESSLPSSFDLSTSPTFPAVGDQARQPSCAAWAATYYAYGFAEANDLEWTQAKAGSPDQLMSPGWTYNKVNGGRDSGSWTDDNMFILRDWGGATLATMPYDDTEYMDWGSPSAFREAPEHRADEVFYIPYSSSTTIDDIKVLVTEGTLVTFALDANEFIPGLADNYVISSSEYSSSSLNHAQTIVGFDDSVGDDGDTGAFRVVNSWGADWGQGGFYWFTYDAIRELGTMGLLHLNYISDVPDYSPQLVATWHFNSPPSRSAGFELGLGVPSSPSATKVPFYAEDRSASHTFPTYMCLDVTEFSDLYAASDDPFYLEVGSSSARGTISSFKVQEHLGGFEAGRADRTSAQSTDVPKATPGIVTVSLPHGDPISVEDALDRSPLMVGAPTEVQWVGVDHMSVDGQDSLQSGDAGDGEATAFSLSVTGPVDVSFKWKVSSESGGDTLSFEIIETGVGDSIDGDHGWALMSYFVGDGSHTLVWSYTKDSSGSELADTAWVDSIEISAPPIDFSLETFYTCLAGAPLTVTPMDVVNPASSELVFSYDWGDGSPVSVGDPESDHSATHTYASPGEYDLAVTMEDDAFNSVTRGAEVRVGDSNQRPVVESFGVSPESDYHEPYSAVQFTVAASDPDGNPITVTVSIPSLGVTLEDTKTSTPETTVTFEFDYTCPLGDEAAYEVVATAQDDAEHLTGSWDSRTVDLLVNSLPVPSLAVEPVDPMTGEMVEFDASGSYDAETSSEDLEARWDWDSDGTWDTEWSGALQASHCYLVPGSYVITVEVRDGNGLSSAATTEVDVSGEPIPEFSVTLIPVVAMLLLFVAMARRRRSRH